MNKRRRHVDRLLEIARSSREWVKDLVDIGALSSEQLDKMNERLEVLDEYARLHGLNYAGARLAPRRAHRANGAAQAAPARLGGSAAASAAGCSGNTTATGTPDGRVALEGGTALLTGTPQTASILQGRNSGFKNISNANLGLVSAPPTKNTRAEISVRRSSASSKMGGKKLSTCPNPYQEVELAFFAPQTPSGEIKDFDSTFDIFKDEERVGCVDYDNNLLDQIEARQKEGLLPKFGPDVLIDWEKIRESNKAQGLEDFYGGIDGGTRLTYQGDWFSDETENVVPLFSKYVLRRMFEDEDGFLTESETGALYLEGTADERLTDYFKSIGAYNPQNEKEAIIADWLEREGDERKLLFFKYLDYLQDLAKSQQSEYKKGAAPVYLEVEGGFWQMMPSGMGSGVHCRWRLERGGVKIGIHSNPKGTIPAVIVEFGYQSIKFRKFPDVVAEVEKVLSLMGFNITSQKISRIDLQLTVDLPFSVVARSYNENRFVSRVTKWAVYQGKICRMDTDQEIQTPIQSIIGGSGKTIKVRLYDKIKECFKSPENLEKLNDLYAVMGVREHFTRVEFELCREWLNEWGINTVDDFYANLPEILHYLTSSYFRVIENAKTSHVEKQQTAQWWEDVQKKFELVFNATYEGKALQRIESKVYTPDAYMKQALGCIKAAYSNLGGERPMRQSEFYAAVFRTVKQSLPQLYDDYVKLWKTNKIQREPLTSLKAEYDYSKIVQKRYDLMIDDEEEEGEGD